MKSKLSCPIKSAARAISALRSAGIQVSGGRIRGNNYVFFVHSKQESGALSALKGRGIECKLIRSGGGKYIKSRLALNAGVLIASVMALVAGIICSLFVFKAEVACEDKTTSALIMQILQENVGKRKSEIDEKALTEEIYASADNVSFVHLKVKGSTLSATVIMQNETPDEPASAENVYALCDGVVESIAVFSGTAEVKAGDVIKKGELLISGRRVVGQDDMGEDVYESCPASGVVTARTYTGGRTKVPASYAEKVRTGRSESYDILNLCGIVIGKDGGCEYEFYERAERVQNYSSLPPFSLTKVTYYELNAHIRDISQADLDVIVAQKQAEYLAELQGSEVLSEHKSIKKLDNYYIIDIYYEHIASAAG